MSEMTREQLNAMAIKSDLLKRVLETWNLKNLNSETFRLNPVFLVKRRRRTPLQADGASEASPHKDSTTRI